MESSNQDNPRWLQVAFGGLAFVTIALFFVPAFVIRPFRYQSPKALLLAMAVRQRAPLWTLITGILCVLVGLALWKAAGKWQRICVSVVALLVVASATMARLNYFEWIFHPVKQPGFESIGQTKLDSGEMVLALTFNGDARAYPIREMAYHHIVNDVVGGVPVVVTY